MADEAALIECFNDTRRLIRDDPALNAASLRAQAGTVLYLPDYRAILREKKSCARPIEVKRDTTFHCAQALASGTDRVAVLNFANAYTPGGDVTRGVMAQEECLCRSSTLYDALTTRYILKNYYKVNSRTTGDMGTDAVIYTPGVRVFKSDDALPVLLDAPFDVDVISCAAPYVDLQRRKPVPREKLAEVLERRVRNILEVAIANGVDDLVLGAFGCGAFNNSPEQVSGIFRLLLVEREYRDFFRRVVFAIKAGDSSDRNYAAYAMAFSDCT